MRIGAERLIQRYGSVARIAEALILGKIDDYDGFAAELVDDLHLKAARMRLEMRAAGYLNSTRPHTFTRPVKGSPCLTEDGSYDLMDAKGKHIGRVSGESVHEVLDALNGHGGSGA